MKAAEHHCFLHRFLALAAALLLLGGLIFAPALSAPVLADGTTQTLRVGYYAYDGFNMIDSDGSYSGYSYDLLQKLRGIATLPMSILVTTATPTMPLPCWPAARST